MIGLSATIFMFFAVLVMARPAYAYIDPGSGSMIIQGIIAAIAAIGVTLGIFWQKVKDFLGRIFGRKKPGE